MGIFLGRPGRRGKEGIRVGYDLGASKEGKGEEKYSESEVGMEVGTVSGAPVATKELEML